MATRKQIDDMIDDLFLDRIDMLEELRRQRGPHSDTDGLLLARIQEDKTMLQELRTRHDAMFSTPRKK